VAETSTQPAPRDEDVVDLLIAQHARIEELFRVVMGATGSQRQNSFNELVQVLAVHETAEEEVVHPAARTSRADAGAMVDARLAEEREAKQMLVELMDIDINSDDFDARLLQLRQAVLTHAKHEERYEFGYLRRNVSPGNLRRMAKAVRAAEQIAPTRPHPGTEAASTSAIAGLPMAIVDRVRDAIRDSG
jgi:hypothetical protein